MSDVFGPLSLEQLSLFPEKTFHKERILLKDKVKTITGNKKLQNRERRNKIINLDYVLRGIEKHANHPNILKIKRKMIGKSFCYENVDEKSCS